MTVFSVTGDTGQTRGFILAENGTPTDLSAASIVCHMRRDRPASTVSIPAHGDVDGHVVIVLPDDLEAGLWWAEFEVTVAGVVSTWPSKRPLVSIQVREQIA